MESVRNSVAITNDSSTGSKASMAILGYFDDKFIGHFVEKRERRSPLINRGYFIRVWAIDHFVRQFLSEYNNEELQIVNCGAGFDSSYFRLRNDGCLNRCIFVEADLPVVTERKKEFVTKFSHSLNCSSNSVQYFLLPCDLRKTDEFFDLLHYKCGLDFYKPTLFIAECVINYLQPDESDKLIEYCCTRFSQSTIIVYEQIVPHDSFGRFMLQHFLNIKSPLLSIFRYPSLADQRLRYTRLKWPNVSTFDMLYVYRNLLDDVTRVSVNNLEPFDEYEMWDLKCSHYVMTVSTQNSKFAQNIPAKTVTMNKEENVIDLDKSSVKRFGHKCCAILNDRYVVVCGGLGQDVDGRHCRLKSLVAVNLSTYEILKLTDNEVFERCYHSFTALTASTAFLFGGRKSPKQALSDSCLIKFYQNPIEEDEQLSITVTKIVFSNGPVARWRHAACYLSENSVFIYGGIQWPYVVLKDCWILYPDQDNNRCKQLPDAPFSLHSHFCCCQNDKIFVYGGMVNNTCGFNKCLLVFDLQTTTWTIVNDSYFSRGIYSHSGHLESETGRVILVGGVMESGEENNGFIFCTTKGGRPVKLCRRSSNDNDNTLLMLTNHDSIWLKNNDRILIVGGGGNCFSFGTLLNAGLTIINVPTNVLNAQ